MTKTELIEKNRKKLEQFEEAYSDLERKYNEAVSRLETIGRGFHYSGEVQSHWSNDTKLQVAASKGLEKLARMPQTKKPSFY